MGAGGTNTKDSWSWKKANQDDSTLAQSATNIPMDLLDDGEDMDRTRRSAWRSSQQ